MIPSLNAGIHARAKAAYDDWKNKFDEEVQRVGPENSHTLPKELHYSPIVPIMCDCCTKVVNFYNASDFLSWTSVKEIDETKPDRWILVGGTRYWACGSECARILFLIHHQYAMREGKNP